jgi:hypothetical protein
MQSNTRLQPGANAPRALETVCNGFPPPPPALHPGEKPCTPHSVRPHPADARTLEIAGNPSLTAVAQSARRLQVSLTERINSGIRAILGLAARLSAHPVYAPFLHSFCLTFSTVIFAITSPSTTSEFPPPPMVQFWSTLGRPHATPAPVGPPSLAQVCASNNWTCLFLPTSMSRGGTYTIETHRLAGPRVLFGPTKNSRETPEEPKSLRDRNEAPPAAGLIPELAEWRTRIMLSDRG